MKRSSLLFACLALILLAGVTRTADRSTVQAQAATESATQQATALATADANAAQVLFEDFDYKTPEDVAFTKNGWIMRSKTGWPGIPGANWPDDQLSFVDDPDTAGNHLLQLNASNDGKTVNQAQICQQRKFFEGTYASRIRFIDTPAAGPDGDQLVQSFYLISPYVRALDPNYSEMDFEYLPNGGWGAQTNFQQTTWYTVQIEPWNADNANNLERGSMEGWHVLVMTVGDDHVKYYADGKLLADHTGKYYPRVPLSINYNLWFINGGSIQSSDLRKYTDQIDWTYFVANKVLSPDEVAANVEALRKDKVSFTDSVLPQDPPLESPCDL